jgi:hypothetical protein
VLYFFAQVFIGHILWGSYGIATRRWGALVGKSSVTGQKAHNFWSQRLIELKYLHEFLIVVFFGVDVVSLLCDNEL